MPYTLDPPTAPQSALVLDPALPDATALGRRRGHRPFCRPLVLVR